MTKVDLDTLLSSDNIETHLNSLTFEQGLQLMVSLCDKMEKGELPLNDAVNSYEKGTKLLKSLSSQLEAAETKIKTLKEE